jgi:Big-like domain-containing protein
VFGTITCSSGTTCSGSVGWITGPLPPAAYEVQAVATDTAGNQTVSAPVTINKDATSPTVPSGATGGAADTTPPTVSITAPSNGAWTGNSIEVAATASDNVGLTSIKLWGNGSVFGTINCSGTTCSGSVGWLTGPLPPAAYQVHAVATDTAGNRTISSPIVINKDATSPIVPSGAQTGAADTTPPTVSITSPPNGAWTGNSIEVAATASDNVGLTTIKLWGNGGVFGTISCSGTACSGTVGWLTGPLAPAAYQMQAVATDTAGNRTISAPVTINKDATSPLVPSGAQ